VRQKLKTNIMSVIENKLVQEEKPSLKIVRQFNVAPEVAFDAFTDPDAMRVWWTDDTTFDMDLRAGGTWTITRKEGDMVFTMTGEYLEFDRPYHLRQTISMPQFSPNSDIVTIDVKPVGNGGCEVTFVQNGDDIAAELEGLAPGTVSESEKGWQQGFDLMEAAWKK
jgi:uncharacterized protein YndB with AHSA1/START domain